MTLAQLELYSHRFNQVPCNAMNKQSGFAVGLSLTLLALRI